MLADLGDLSRTIASEGKVVQDNWRKTEMAEGPCEDSAIWAGSCIFRESWSTTSEEVHQIDRAAGIPGSLVFTNIPEYSLVDDLSGDSLPAPLVTLAKREEITEMYRRKVWRNLWRTACEIRVSPNPCTLGCYQQGGHLTPER